MQDVVDPLTALRDIHLPAQPPWWPPTLAWWLLLAGIILTLLLVSQACFLWRRWRYRLRHNTLDVINQLRCRYQNGDGQQQVLADLSYVLKHTAMQCFPQRHVAGLSGTAWLHFLDQTGRSTEFLNGPGNCLLTAPYQQDPEVDMGYLFDLAERWVKVNA